MFCLVAAELMGPCPPAPAQPLRSVCVFGGWVCSPQTFPKPSPTLRSHKVEGETVLLGEGPWLWVKTASCWTLLGDSLFLLLMDL